MLKLINVSKKFKDFEALSEINLEIETGKVIGLLGPNGAGKTTLMRIITGFYGMSGGEMKWDNKAFDPKLIKFRKEIGYLPENNPLYVQMSVGEYLEFVGNIKGIEKEKLEKEVKEKIKSCGLENVAIKKIETLSKGYRQRVGLAAAMLSDPKLLILDEATSGLDPNQIIEVRNLIKKLAKNRTILFSTHILPEAKAICDRLLIINKGEIVLDEETSKVKNIEKKFIELTA